MHASEATERRPGDATGACHLHNPSAEPEIGRVLEAKGVRASSEALVLRNVAPATSARCKRDRSHRVSHERSQGCDEADACHSCRDLTFQMINGDMIGRMVEELALNDAQSGS